MRARKNIMFGFKSIHALLRQLAAIFIALVFTGIGSVMAQSDTSLKETVPNEAMKSVFQQLKKEVKTNDTLSSLLMIGGVIIIVLIAVYLSFKSGDKDKKQSIKRASAAKKA